MKKIRLKDESSYTLIEIMVVTAILGIVISSLYIVKKNIYDTWKVSKLESTLEQELRISMNMIITNLQQAKSIKKIKEGSDSRVIYIDPNGEEKVIYYRAEGHLCLNADYNIISNKIKSFNLKRSNDLLYITLSIQENGREELLKTAIKIRAEQL